jgi:hypothetical protein
VLSVIAETVSEAFAEARFNETDGSFAAWRMVPTT